MSYVPGFAINLINALPSKETFAKGVIVGSAITSIALGALAAMKPFLVQEAGKFLAFKAISLGAISLGSVIGGAAAFIVAHPFVLVAAGVGALALLLFAKMALEIKSLKATIDELNRRRPIANPARNVPAAAAAARRPLPTPPGPSLLDRLGRQREEIANLNAKLDEANRNLEIAKGHNLGLIDINRGIVQGNEKNIKEIEALRRELEALKVPAALLDVPVAPAAAAASASPIPLPPPPPPYNLSPLETDGVGPPAAIKDKKNPQGARAALMEEIARRPRLGQKARKDDLEDWQSWLVKYGKSWETMDQVLESLKFVDNKINAAERDLSGQAGSRKNQDMIMSYASPSQAGAAANADKEKIKIHLNGYKKTKDKLHAEAPKLANNQLNQLKYEMFKKFRAPEDEVSVSDDEPDDEYGD